MNEFDSGVKPKTLYTWKGSTDPAVKTGIARFPSGGEWIELHDITAAHAREIHDLIQGAYADGWADCKTACEDAVHDLRKKP